QKNEAMRREKEIKGWKSKKLIEKLIRDAGSEHSDLKSEVVTGSIPVASTTERKASNKWSFFAFKEFILQFSLMYTVYIIYSPSLDRYYIGFTQDITDRLRRHNSKSKGFTNRANDWIIVHVESFNQKNEAMRREKEIKGWKSKKLIEKLIRDAGSEHSDL
ncbi:GIY-YIG nuclease family protein, partial [Sphingobacterium mizutaii]|uniref:GIY-YIG nuclease family protein n=2 Tax=Sphingobacterium TaxID=28453 RepID=UPI001F298666